MAKLNSPASRQASALADDEDEVFLRPAAPANPRRRGRAPVTVPIPRMDPAEEAEAFLRTRRRVPARKSGLLLRLLRTRFGRLVLASALLAIVAAVGIATWAVLSFLHHDPHFRIESSAEIQTTGTNELSRDRLLAVFGSDIGRNIFYVPLAKREAALEAEPWVKHAVVMRLLPHTLRVAVTERVPIAFVRIGHDIELVDADGVLLPMAPATLAARHYSFPVVTGLDPNAPADQRAVRMRLFLQFVAALDAGGAKNSAQLSEVDLSDTDDVRAVVPAQGTDILLHFGNSDFLNRWRSYQEHIAVWRQQYPNLSAVDLRYERQVVLKMANAAAADQAQEARPLPRVAAAATYAGFGAVSAVGRVHRHPAAAHPTGHRSVVHPAARRAPRSRSPRKEHRNSRWKPHYIARAGRDQ